MRVRESEIAANRTLRSNTHGTKVTAGLAQQRQLGRDQRVAGYHVVRCRGPDADFVADSGNSVRASDPLGVYQAAARERAAAQSKRYFHASRVEQRSIAIIVQVMNSIRYGRRSKQSHNLWPYRLDGYCEVTAMVFSCIAVRTLSGVNGDVVIRTPSASQIALPIAGVTHGSDV